MNDLFSKKLGLIHYVALAIVLYFAFYYGLSAYGIRDINEGLYAKIAWEMWSNNQYVIPTINQLIYLENPPLLYWLTSLSYSLFGVNAFGARFVSATTGVLLCMVLIFFGNRIQRPREGWLAALILASSPVVLLIAHMAFFAMLLVLVFSASLFSFYCWYQQNNRWWLRAAYMFAALVILTKGLFYLILIPLICLSFMLLTQAPWRRYLQLFDILGIVLFILIAAPWHVLAMMQHEGFAWEYFFNAHLLWFFSGHEAFDYSTGPIYHYLPHMVVYILPWSIVLLVSLLQWHIYKPLEPIHKFLWVWIIIPLLFFTIAKAKTDYYMFTAVPAMVFLLALGLQEYIRLQKYKTLLACFIVIAAGLIITAGIVGYTDLVLVSVNESAAKVVFKQALWILIIYTAIALLAHIPRRKPIVTIIAIVGLLFPVQYTLINMQYKLNNLISSEVVANYLLDHAGKDNVYLYQDYEGISSIPFYMQRSLPIIDSQSRDLAYGQQITKDKQWFITSNDFVKISKRNMIYVVLAKPRRLVSFNQAIGLSQFCEVLRNGHVIVLTNDMSQCY